VVTRLPRQNIRNGWCKLVLIKGATLVVDAAISNCEGYFKAGFFVGPHLF